MKRNTPAWLIAIMLIIVSCANQTAPTGGPKDETPPALISSTPKQGELNFSGKEIILNFDELVRTENPKEQFIITPRVDQEYEVKYRKNRVIIAFEKALEDSTTYSINFREGIKDVTEGNAADTLKLAFSTGNFLDSLSVTGHVTELLTNKDANDATVALYKANDTLSILNSPPVYFTKTSADGSFTFENLKNGQYRIYAFNDKNKNLLVESKSEKYGFLSDTLNLDSSITDLEIPIQMLDIRDFEFQSARQSGTTYNVKYNKYVLDYMLEPLDTTLELYSNYTDKTHNTIQIFKPATLTDSAYVMITARDSLNNSLRDTVSIKYEQTERSPAEFTTTAVIDKVITSSPTFKITMNFNKPVFKVNHDSIYLFLDSAHVTYFKEEDFTWNKRHDELQISQNLNPDLFVTSTPAPAPAAKVNKTEKQLDENTTSEAVPEAEPAKPHFYASAATFISVEQDSSKLINQNLSFSRPEQLGVIIVEIHTEASHYFVQLLNKANEVVAEETNGRKFQFKNIEPGEYRMRILVDNDNNGTWDNGNMLLNKEPETVIFYTGDEENEKIVLRANWEFVTNVISF